MRPFMDGLEMEKLAAFYSEPKETCGFLDKSICVSVDSILAPIFVQHVIGKYHKITRCRSRSDIDAPEAA